MLTLLILILQIAVITFLVGHIVYNKRAIHRAQIEASILRNAMRKILLALDTAAEFDALRRATLGESLQLVADLSVKAYADSQRGRKK